MSLSPRRLTPEQAFPKLKHFCSYQERSHAEVVTKAYSLGLWKKDVDVMVSRLIEENYLNEERYARAFAGGKFRMKQWGRVKIMHELKQKKISDYCIRKAMKEIDADDYARTLERLAEKKLASLKGEKNIFIRKRKLTDYLLQKGFEYDLCGSIVRELTTTT